MAEKVKAKKAKTLSKKASPKGRKIEAAAVQQDDSDPAPVIKRNKTGKIVTRSSRESQDESIDSNDNVNEQDESEELPPLEQKFSAGEPIQARESKIIIDNRSNPAQDSGEQLRIKLSKSLTRKLREQAADEGIGLDEFISELLSESVVLRAWEIVERKNQMKGGSQPLGNSRSSGGHNQPQNRNQGPRGNKGQRGMNHSRYQNIMEDKGAFLEYVRSQERNRR